MSTWGKDSVRANAKINSFIESKKLTFGQKKCKQMHIGKENNICPILKVHGKNMGKESNSKYLGDIISVDGKNTLNFGERKKKAYIQ